MRIHLDGISVGITEALRILNSDLQDINGEITGLYKQEGILNSEIQDCEREIAQIDTDALIKVAEDSVDNPFYFFQPLQEQALQVICRLPIDEVKCILGDRNCFWGNALKIEPDRKKATRMIKSYFCGGIAGTLTAYVKSKIYYVEDLTKFRENLLRKTATLSDIRAKICSKSFDAKSKGSEVEKFKSRAIFAGGISGRLNSNSIPLMEFLKTRDLVSKISRSPEELVSLYCKELGIDSAPLKI